MLLKKSEVPAPPLLKEETVHVPELNGDVIVRGMGLKDRLDIATTDGYGGMAVLLSSCVFVEGEANSDGTPGDKVQLYTADEWERWGVKNYNSALKLWAKARDLSDLQGIFAAKNLTAQKSDSPAA